MPLLCCNDALLEVVGIEKFLLLSEIECKFCTKQGLLFCKVGLVCAQGAANLN